MKKLFGLLLTFALVMALFVGCGKDEEETPADSNENVDTVTAASMVTDGQGVIDGLAEDGVWIVCALNDVEVDEEIVVEGTFYDKNDTSKDIYRKLALYTQDDERNIIDQFTLTAPKMTVRSENFKIQGGTFVGDVYVEANGFTVGKEATIEGNVYFASQENLDSAVVDETAVVTGAMELAAGEVDAVTTASIVDNGEAVVAGLAEDGVWIVCTLNDVEVDEEIVVEGTFYDKNDTTKDIYRKLALYTQDEERNITAQFTLTAPKMTVRSENFKIQGGTFVGDVYVEANGFNVGKEATIEGNVYYASQEYMDSAVVDETGEITGTVEVQ